MLVCNVSLRARRTIAVEIEEDAGAAEDVVGLAVPLTLIDEPAEATDTLSAFTGEVLHEAADASDSFSAGLLYAVMVDEPAAANDDTSVYAPATYDVSITEAATATDAPNAAAPVDPYLWNLVGSWTHSTNVAQVDFTGLAGYTEIRVLLRLVPVSVGNVRRIRVSSDNGATFYSTSGNYIDVSTDGVETNQTAITINASVLEVSARSWEYTISNWNLTDAKIVQHRTRTDLRQSIIPVSTAMNALRVMADIDVMTGGSIYVWAR